MVLNNCRIVLEDGIVEHGSLGVDQDRISWISGDNWSGGNAVDLQGMYLVPGFVDIHCHGSGSNWFFDHPEEAARFHLQEGTTSLLCSLWRNAGTYSYIKAIQNIRRAMAVPGSNIRGIHMEGPYLDPDLGSEGGTPWPIQEEEYEELLRVGEGVIRQWTFDPAQPGAEAFAKAAQRAGIRLAVCYSKATPEQLEKFLPYGLRLGSHMLCGSGQPESRFGGTREPGSDQFVLYQDCMTAEVIADSLGAHVRPYYLKLIYKVKGPDRIALVSDCCAGGETGGSDINVINGELYGSRLTLSVALRNMREHTGAGLVELCKMAAATPAKVVGLFGERGSIAPHKKADLVILDRELRVRGVFAEGRMLRRDF